ncbi:MAG: PEP-CTERM sorting domain-containing protein [Terriglobia bacterium]
MRKVRLLCLSVVVLAVATMCMPAFGNTEDVTLSCDENTCGGESGAVFQFATIGSSGDLLGGGLLTATIVPTGTPSVAYYTGDDVSVDGLGPYALYPGDYATVNTYPGGTLTVTDGDVATLLAATLGSFQNGNIPTPMGDNNPAPTEFFNGQFTVTYVDPAFFGSTVQCAAGSCGTGSIRLLQQENTDGSASLNASIDLADTPADPPPTDTPEPSSIVLLLLGGGFLAVIMKKRGVGGRSWRFSTGGLFHRG